MKTLCLFAVLLGVSHLSGCGARGAVRVSIPQQVKQDDESQDADEVDGLSDPTPTQKDLDEAIIEALTDLYAARDAEKGTK